MKNEIFKPYDIRGVYPSEIDENAMYWIGKAIVRRFKTKEVVVARDCRLSSPSLLDALKKALIEEGVNIAYIGERPTPMTYFASKLLNSDFALAVTASHNPKEYNGLKLYIRDRNLYPEEIKELGVLAKQLMKKEKIKSKDTKGTFKETNIDDKYVDRVIESIRLKKPLKVMVDAGNGVGGIMAEKVLSKLKHLGIEYDIIFKQPDGNFPNHHPDPLKVENTEFLRRKVRETEADLGVALDGDADRIVFIDENGNYVPGDITLGILALEFLESRKDVIVVTEVKASKSLVDFVEGKGGKVVMGRVGRTYIERSLKESSGDIAGELSGHYFYKENGYDDAIFTMVKMIEMLSKNGKKLSEFVSSFPKYVNTPEIRLKVPEENKYELINELTKSFKEKGYDVLDIDGARVNFSFGWGLVRASNTEPAITLRFEADTEENLKKIKDLFSKELGKHGVEL